MRKRERGRVRGSGGEIDDDDAFGQEERESGGRERSNEGNE